MPQNLVLANCFLRLEHFLLPEGKRWEVTKKGNSLFFSFKHSTKGRQLEQWEGSVLGFSGEIKEDAGGKGSLGW